MSSAETVSEMDASAASSRSKSVTAASEAASVERITAVGSTTTVGRHREGTGGLRYDRRFADGVPHPNLSHPSRIVVTTGDVADRSARLGALGYRNGPGLRHLPLWARFLVALGRFSVEHRRPQRRLVLAVSLPTRAYAAAFTALGIAAAAYQDPEERDARKHFDWLATLPAGTAIRFRRGRYLYCARLLGVEVRQGIEHLTYQDQSKCYLPWDKCREVQPLDPSDEFIRRRLLAPNATFVQAALGVDPLAHAAHTSLDCLIVGTKETLREELLGQQFMAPAGQKLMASGVLNDLLRCDAFELNANDHDRTSVVSALADEVPERLIRETPPAVLFDGPSGYLRLRSNWKKSPWVVLIDRTSPSATAAADAFNQELALSIEDADLSALGSPPDAFEVRGFYEAVR